jgi:hypothetical protein
MRAVHLLHAALATIAVLLAGAAMSQPAPEYAIKAAYIYNFAMFTEWPVDTLADGAPITLCARADHPLRSALESVTDKTIKGRRLTVRTWDRTHTARDCQIVVLDNADKEHWKTLKGQAGLPGVLSIGDDGADMSGIVIVLGMEDGRLGFSVQSGAARQAGLVLSARLLRLAKVVQ